MVELIQGDELTAALRDLPGVTRAAVGAVQLRVEAESFPAAVALVDAVARVAEEMNHHPDVDLRWRTVVFTLSTHSAGGVTGLDLELARRILALAGEGGAAARPTRPRVEIMLDVADQAAVQAFWAVGLGYRPVETLRGEIELQDPDGAGPVLAFQPMDPPRTERSRFHLDVYLPEAEVQQRIQAVLAAGGRLVTDEFAPNWWVLADPEGNELCVCRA